MKTKLFLAAVAVAFSFAVTSCGNKTANSDASAESAGVEMVEAAASCCKADSATCDKAAACDSTKCKDKAGCDKKAECKKACEKK